MTQTGQTVIRMLSDYGVETLSEIREALTMKIDILYLHMVSKGIKILIYLLEVLLIKI